MKKVIAFDLDGTLIDSLGIGLEGFVFSSKKLKLNLKKDELAKIYSLTEPVLLRKHFPKIKEKTIKEFQKTARKHFFKNVERIKSFPSVEKTLTELKKRYKIIIISNTNYKLILEALESAKLNPLFFDIIVGEDLVKNAKPSPDELNIAKKILNHKVDYFVGDSPVDLKAGKRAKVKTIGITTGYSSKKDLQEQKPFAIIDKMGELLEIL